MASRRWAPRHWHWDVPRRPAADERSCGSSPVAPLNGQDAMCSIAARGGLMGDEMKQGALRLAAASCLLLAVTLMNSPVAAEQSQVPRPPTDLELVAGSDSSITISWAPSSGATSYNIYRGSSSGSEGGALIATTTDTMYTDPNLRPQPIYFYQLTAVNAAGESARS